MDKIKTLIAMITPTPEIRALLSEIEADAEISFLGESEDIGSRLHDVEVLYGVIPEKDFSKANKIRWLQTNSTGVDHMMYPAFQNSDIILTNTGYSISTIVAEHALVMLFALARNLHIQRDYMREHKWKIECGVEIGSLSLGIIGFGKIGSAIAHRARPFFKDISILDMASVEKPAYVKHVYGFTELHEMLEKCNAVICSIPFTPQTKGLISDAEFSIMPDRSYIINISRGGIVDEKALVRALRSGKLAGAGLDVTEQEPCPPESPLWNEPNLLLTPHSAGFCQDLEKRKITQFIKNFKSYAREKRIPTAIDKKRGW